MVPYQILDNYSFILSFGKRMIEFQKGMHVNETIRNESKTCRKIKGGTYNISIILAANCPRVLNLESNLC